jgi:hypothetical protein
MIRLHYCVRLGESFKTRSVVAMFGLLFFHRISYQINIEQYQINIEQLSQ